MRLAHRCSRKQKVKVRRRGRSVIVATPPPPAPDKAPALVVLCFRPSSLLLLFSSAAPLNPFPITQPPPFQLHLTPPHTNPTVKHLHCDWLPWFCCCCATACFFSYKTSDKLKEKPAVLTPAVNLWLCFDALRGDLTESYFNLVLPLTKVRQ